ncbi:hypothetical protein HYH02_015546 [Chlamydomonas schloesseri]|uniref:Stage V sporulation protein S n=1 Tax=Chlamydomonas schloesseri TaxID=2026947 RepID=A0A835VNL9_9CHLO|nr:hypothetical protein HYH02_015546 [Chlamydomonas schloesseri]|eukprot:KAG2422005.1 hypothetical protein HYH02_015546 [Chlamydomonas schloesseri]
METEDALIQEVPAEEAAAESSPTNGNTPIEPDWRLCKGQRQGGCRQDCTQRTRGEVPAALCIGPECINVAIKAIAIARTYLQQDTIDLSFQPAFRDADRSKKSLALYIAKGKVRAPISTVDDVEMPIGSQSKPQVVAGALAARIREEKTVCLTAIGIDAVSNAVLAIGNARLYLEQDRKDIRAMPSFVQVHKNGRDLNAVRFALVVENI